MLFCSIVHNPLIICSWGVNIVPGKFHSNWDSAQTQLSAPAANTTPLAYTGPVLIAPQLRDVIYIAGKEARLHSISTHAVPLEKHTM